MVQDERNITYPPLDKDISVDVAIIGGGLAGISAAYFLAKSGKSVAVLEAAFVGSGATSKTTAFLTQVIDTQLSDLVSMFGPEKAWLIWQSHGQAIDTVEQIIKDEQIDCSFMRCPSYYYANSEKELKTLQKDYQTAQSLGISVRVRPNDHLPFFNFGCLEIPNQAKFDAGKYIVGLAKTAQIYGAGIFERTEAQNITNKEQAAFEVTTNRQGKVTAKQVIIATYYPLGNPKSTLFKKGMYVSYVLEAQIPKAFLPEAIYEDTANPYNYFRVDSGDKTDTMLIGGQDHRAEIKMNPEKNFMAMEEYFKRAFPDMAYTITSRWTGPILEPSDGLALIGNSGQNQYVATAFSGNGMTYSTIAGLLLNDLISGQPNSWQELYDPKRVPSLKQLAKKGKDFTEELFRGALKNAFK